ncbi:dCTP deaminase [Acidobacteriia bacterium AH_259_A11_L15]|nr:dCTP deaminase [Acidobacteriia bacterium AH_259_A11_L15]
MQLVSGKQAVQRVQNLVSEKHQVHAYAVELSARQIYGLSPVGQVDFGGSEYVAAERQPVPTHQKHSQDKYQWWTLMHGAYLVEFNETLELAEDEIALLEPHERLLRAGAEHPSLYLRGKQNPLTILLSVSGAKMEVKQNARLSTLRVFRLAGAPKAAKPPAKKKKR